MTSLGLCLTMLIRTIFGVRLRDAELVWRELNLLLTRKSTYKCGRYNECYGDVDYIGNLRSLASELEKDLFNPFNSNNFKYARTIKEAREVAEDLHLAEMNTLLRNQPFAILIQGKPGTGKSMTAMKLCTLVLELSGVCPTPKDFITLNEGDEFQSEFRTHHKAVIFDDLGATRSTVVGQDPFRKVIDFINNVPRTALNPHLELKGNVWIEPTVVVATTNLNFPLAKEKGQQNNIESLMCPSAIDRRFKIKINQVDFNTYEIVSEDKKTANVQITWGGLVDLVTRKYREHEQGQKIYLRSMEKLLPGSIRPDLVAESATLGWNLVTLLQAFLRMSYYKQILEGGWSGSSVIMLNFRRFLAYPLNEVKSQYRKQICDQLFELGFSRMTIAHLVDRSSTMSRRISTLLSTAILVIMNGVEGPTLAKVAQAGALLAYDGVVRLTFGNIYNPIVYDTSVLFLGTVVSSLIRTKVFEAGYGTKIFAFFREGWSRYTWVERFLLSLWSFVPMIQFVGLSQILGETMDRWYNLFTKKKYKAESKSTRRRTPLQTDYTLGFANFRYAFTPTRFRLSEKPEGVSCATEPNLAKADDFLKCMIHRKPTSTTIGDFMSFLGMTRYGHIVVAEPFSLNRTFISPGPDYRLILDEQTDTLLVLFNQESCPDTIDILMRVLIGPLLKRFGLNIAYVSTHSEHIGIYACVGSELKPILATVYALQRVSSVSRELLVLGKSHNRKWKTVNGYRFVKTVRDTEDE